MGNVTLRRARMGVPRWVWAAAAALACIQPALHAWLAYFPPEGTAPTGLAVNDTVVFRHALRMFETGFESRHATCQSPWGDHDIRYYSSPLHWLYGLLGPLGRLLHIPEFLYLGLLNGLGMFAYLIAAYTFLRAAVPALAAKAWAIFALTTGPGGVAYLLTGVMGWHDAPRFEQAFWRFAYYDLTEAAQMWPMLHMARLYYTLPLALGLWALARFIRYADDETGTRRRWAMPMAALLIATFFNIRVGPMLGLAACCFLLCRADIPARRRLGAAAVLWSPILLGLALAALMLSTRSSYLSNANAMAATVMWYSPFLCAAGIHLALAAGPIVRTLPPMAPLPRLVTGAALGYAAAFALLFLGYQLYYGNWLYGGDDAGARAVSDWAFLGAAAGLMGAWAMPRNAPDDARSELDWIVLWFVAFAAAAPSLAGDGWLLRLSPQRLMVLMGLPLSILAAAGLAAIARRRPRLSHGILAAMVACGVTSIAVAWFALMGPLGPPPGQGAYAFLRVGLMSNEDAALLDHLAPGATLAPAERQPFFGDVVSLRPEGRAIFGTGTLDLSTLLSLDMRAEVERFFAPDTPEAERLAFVKEWCVVNILCPDSAPIAPETLAALRATPWLDESATVGNGAVFRIRL